MSYIHIRLALISTRVGLIGTWPHHKYRSICVTLHWYTFSATNPQWTSVQCVKGFRLSALQPRPAPYEGSGVKIDAQQGGEYVGTFSSSSLSRLPSLKPSTGSFFTSTAAQAERLNLWTGKGFFFYWLHIKVREYTEAWMTEDGIDRPKPGDMFAEMDHRIKQERHTPILAEHVDNWV